VFFSGLHLNLGGLFVIVNALIEIVDVCYSFVKVASGTLDSVRICTEHCTFACFPQKDLRSIALEIFIALRLTVFSG
jgi:hypothetical protein